MSGGLHRLVRGWWAGQGGVAGRFLQVVTAPAELAYRVEIARRDRRYTRHGGARVAGLRVVSVGNLTVGGTGKTPLAAWVGRTLGELGARPALLARGYGRDEIELHRRWNPGLPVLADPDRLASARLARSRGADAAVLDDGFQHRRLARDVDLVLLAAEDPFPGRLLPRGPYREPIAALERAHGVVVTRRTASPAAARGLAEAVARTFHRATTATLHLAPAGWRALTGEPASAPAGPILAVAGIGRPEDFARQLTEALDGEVELASFPDHHEYTARDVEALAARAKGRTLVTTEKDAVKLEAFADRLPTVRVVTLEPRWESGQPDILALLRDVLKKET